MTATAAVRPTRARSLTVPFCLAAAAIASAAVATGFAFAPTPDERWQLAARFTARTSFLLFLPVFVASSWNRLWPSDASRFAMRNRRSLGLAFATAHTIHFVALAMTQTMRGEMPSAATLIGGGGAYVAMIAMVATSNDAAVRLLGKNWRRLHKVGIYWLWFIFTFSYTGRVASGKLFFVPFVAALLGGLGLRIWAARRSPSRRSG